jgi:lipoprotein-anchoring transpeptidase ErfK/SrfK
VSHGCVRMSNGDVMKIYDRVKLGTPVIVEP